MITTVLFDVDGTLVDSNDAHAHAWVKAFEDAGVAAAFEAVRRRIGMGGDKLIPAIAGFKEADSAAGRRVSKRRGEIFAAEYLPGLQPFRDAGRLVRAIESRGLRRGQLREETGAQPLLNVPGAPSLIGRAASGDDAAESKPDPTSFTRP